MRDSNNHQANEANEYRKQDIAALERIDGSTSKKVELPPIKIEVPMVCKNILDFGFSYFLWIQSNTAKCATRNRSTVSPIDMAKEM
mmetsp:Transcript_23584/g.57816  ORF Transcript_23584/g.57816 Transcript_23584/m.57816 type:complete len:86 (+) Transcript_23584:859-1116(+)